MESVKIADSSGAFGANAWLVEDMYEAYLADPSSVSESWAEFFADYRPLTAREPELVSPAAAVEAAEPAAAAVSAPPAASASAPAPTAVAVTAEEVAVPLRGAAARIVGNMIASLEVPTATSVHPVPARLLEVNRHSHQARC